MSGEHDVQQFDFPMARERGRRFPGRNRSGPTGLGRALAQDATGTRDGAFEDVVQRLEQMRSTAPPVVAPPEPSRAECRGCRGGIVIKPDPRGQHLMASACPVCKSNCGCDGSGFVWTTDAAGYHFSRPCRCQLGEAAARRITAAGLPARHCGTWADLEGLAREGGPGGVSSLALLRPVYQWAITFLPGRTRRGWALLGPVGTLKTGLATLAGVEVTFRGSRVLFVECKELWARGNVALADGGAGARDKIIDRMVAADLVILDDVDHVSTDAHRQWLSGAIDRMYRSGSTVLVVTGNRPMRPADGGHRNTLYMDDALGAPAASRLREMCDVRHIDGPDRRFQSREGRGGTALRGGRPSRKTQHRGPR